MILTVFARDLVQAAFMFQLGFAPRMVQGDCKSFRCISFKPDECTYSFKLRRCEYTARVVSCGDDIYLVEIYGVSGPYPSRWIKIRYYDKCGEFVQLKSF